MQFQNLSVKGLLDRLLKRTIALPFGYVSAQGIQKNDLIEKWLSRFLQLTDTLALQCLVEEASFLMSLRLFIRWQ